MQSTNSPPDQHYSRTELPPTIYIYEYCALVFFRTYNIRIAAPRYSIINDPPGPKYPEEIMRESATFRLMKKSLKARRRARDE